MTQEKKEILITRFKALLWHLGTMAVPFVIDFVAQNLSLFNMPTWLSVGIGLVLAQVTKYLNITSQ